MTPSTTSSHARILVVDDEPDLRTLYELTLVRDGYHVSTAENLAQALQHVGETNFDVVITDMRLPDGLGVELIRQLGAQQRRERCVVITAYGSAENAVESLKAGAFDYLTKPVDLKRFRGVIASAVSDARLRTRAGLRGVSLPGGAGEASLARLVGDSAGMRLVKDRIAKVARSMAPILINGESGTGKEMVALAIHANSHRSAGPWVAVNCSAIPENLLETEFFGSKKGAYTGSTQDRGGFFQAACEGTLFLDEIGDLPLTMQSKLLRAIQERCVRPIGSPQEEPVDVRLVSATHKDLAAEVQAGRFRQDLYYRLNVIQIVIPPLRERREDLPALCVALLRRIAHESGIDVPTLPDSLLDQLVLDPLPGNVRELENLLHRAVALSEEDELRFERSMPPSTGELMSVAPPPLLHDDAFAEIPADLQGFLDSTERAILIRALRESGFNRTAAANRLGLSLRQMRYRIARLRIDTPNSADGFDEAG